MSNDWINKPLTDEEYSRASAGTSKTFSKRSNRGATYFYATCVHPHNEVNGENILADSDPIDQEREHAAYVKGYVKKW